MKGKRQPKVSPGEEESFFTKAGVPSGGFAHSEIFRTPEDAATALTAVVKFIKAVSGAPTTPGQSSGLGFIIENLQVSFQQNIKRMRVHTSFASETATITVPVSGTESPSQLQELELRVLGAFFPTIHEAQMRSALQFYRTLDTNGRAEIQKRFGGEMRGLLSKLTFGADTGAAKG